MKHLLIIILFSISFNALVHSQATRIYDIQYTTNPGNGTYPSPLDGQNVSTGGIVTAIDYNNKNYFISSSPGGAWNGIFIYDDDFSPVLGDSIIIQGQVYEYYGFTEIRNLTSFNVISSGHPLPPAAQISTVVAASEEAFESVFVEVIDAMVSETFDEWNDWKVNDGGGSCKISTGFFSLKASVFPLLLNYPFSEIKGLISYSYGDFKLHPRSIADFQSDVGAFVVSTDQHNIYVQEIFSVPVNLSILDQPSTCTSYTLNVAYNADVLAYAGFDQSGSLSQGGLIQDQSTSGNVKLMFTGNFSFNWIETLVKINFTPLASGESNLEFHSTFLNNNPIEYMSSGLVNIGFNTGAIGDTITVIQQPLQNIPAIVIPGDELEILCKASESTSNWVAELIRGQITIPLEIISTEYDPEYQIWTLIGLLSQTEIYELYSLKVTASDDILDITRNAVYLVPHIKDDFYFVHLTDTHLPTHFFYEDPESVYDTSEMQDLREVINDINIFRPEFVLLTGDYLNEGELEDFENRRHHTKAQRILSEFEVPVFLLPGNHDLGGWDATPPPQGTARNEWWRFFGWSWLKNPVGDMHYTQDYSFDYGSVHFTGMESYINYDGYMFDVYGNESFIPSQLQWLENDLQNAAESEARVIFYHKDFANQIDLENMNIDMALYGHIHSNSGNINSPPYNLATAAVCDKTRAFRVIHVNSAVLQPNQTVYAESSGENFTVDYLPENTGFHDSVTAIISNQYNLDFYHGLLKFVMPKGEINYTVQNGNLLQTDLSGDFAICYVNVSIPANQNISVSVVANSSLGFEQDNYNHRVELYQSYPNPFKFETSIRFQVLESEHVRIAIYDISGQLIEILSDKNFEPGFHRVNWDGKNQWGGEAAGKVFYCRLTTQSGFMDVINLIKL